VNRRDFITLLGGAAAAWPLAARAQRPKVPVIGVLEIQSANGWQHYLDAFRQGLNENGFVEGQNVAIEYRWAENDDSRLPALAADLVRRQVSVIAATGGGTASRVAKAATTTIPIVFLLGGDPVALGLVASLNRPGGNVTGFTNITQGLVAKRLGLLHELVPNTTTIAVLIPSGGPNYNGNVRDLQDGARTLGLQLAFINVNNDDEMDAAFPSLLQQKAGAVLLTDATLFNSRREKLAGLAARYRVPAMYTFPEFAAAGGLMSYATSLTDAYRQIGIYTGRILKGDKPADLPVLQPTKFELVINLKTAKTLGLTVPDTLLALADEVIE
jgi:putative tryptophan/tyrosine transport system substrate-binding protein